MSCASSIGKNVESANLYVGGSVAGGSLFSVIEHGIFTFVLTTSLYHSLNVDSESVDCNEPDGSPQLASAPTPQVL